MRLHDLMLDEVDDVRADADTLLARATTARRHRRLASVAGAAAAALLIGGGVWTVAGHDSHSRAIDPATVDTVPASPRALAGALATAISNGSLGDLKSPTRWYGDDASPAGYLTYASWPATDSTHANVGIRLTMFRTSNWGMVFGVDGAAAKVPLDLHTICDDPACKVIDLPDGDTLLTAQYTADASTSGAKSGSSVTFPGADVVLSSPRRDLVIMAVAQADAPTSLPTAAQLAAFVEQPWWGWSLPASYASVPLPGYTEEHADPYASASGSAASEPEPGPSTVDDSVSCDPSTCTESHASASADSGTAKDSHR